MTHENALKVLREIADAGFAVSIVYGQCNCLKHRGALIWSTLVLRVHDYQAISQPNEAAKSFEQCVEIAKAELDEYRRRLN